MNPDLMAVLSLVVAVSLFVVLIGFVRAMSTSLRRTGRTLLAGVDIATTVRQDCEQLVGGILTLNRNLGTAAAGLTTVAASARRRAAAPTPARGQLAAGGIRPPQPSTAAARPAAVSVRPIREPVSDKTFDRVGAWTIRDPSSAGQHVTEADRWAIREPSTSDAPLTGRHSRDV